jgi:hypothetical protein
MPHRRTAKLASWQVWLLAVSGGNLVVSGSIWLLLHYFWPVHGEFGFEPNPLEPWLMRLHGLMVIPALLGIGGLFVAHVPKGWNHKNQRATGAVLGAILSVLITTGYLLYYVGIEEIRPWVSLIHWIAGLALPMFAAWHYINSRAARSAPNRRCRWSARQWHMGRPDVGTLDHARQGNGLGPNRDIHQGHQVERPIDFDLI